jgi:hypothetical protein
MLPENCKQIEIDNEFYPCGKVKRTVLITYLVTTAPSRNPAKFGVPEVAPFDCSQKYTCGVCIPEGRLMYCR